MKLRIGAIAALALAASTLVAQEQTTAQKASPTFENLKSLVGVWTGKYVDGSPVKVTYQMVSAGKVLMETLDMGDSKENMVTMYHPDGDNVMMTHYCSIGNQPRMRASVDPKNDFTITFSFVDATNMASPDDQHMHKLVVTFKDKDHFTQEWTMRAKGEDVHTGVFQYERVK
jgi:hypothetical protein